MEKLKMKKLQNYIQTTFNGYIPGQIFFCRSKWAKTTRLVYLLGSVIILIKIICQLLYVKESFKMTPSKLVGQKNSG